ncbi:MAG: ATP-dependent DNA helicase II subunit 2 [Cirrosporium novae-zelandiae]|nr:MAG: ATP-dependent DNA helicase II subunit 2 [Cirrosporium novae-zelandiae]
MADKEATVYIIDMGASMGKGRGETITLDWTMQYVWDKITTTVSTGRKTAGMGVLGLRTDDTNNELSKDADNYGNISVLHDIGQFLLSDLKDLKEKIKVNDTDSGDDISAIVIAIQMIAKHCRKLKFKKRIVLVTSGVGGIDPDDIDGIIRKIQEDHIELVVLGVDFDDEEYGLQEENKEPGKAENEKILKEMTESCGGVFGTLAEAIEQMEIPRIKPVRPVPSYRGPLTLGNPNQYDSVLSIQVERYPRTSVAKPPTASSFVLRSDYSNGGPSTQCTGTAIEDTHMLDEDRIANSNALTSVKQARTYQVQDEEAPGGKRDVERDDLAKGYEYGRTAVHISETDENITKLETEAGLDIIGFVPQEKYERYMNISQSCIIIASRVSDTAALALSSFINALYEMNSYAIGRLVTKAGKSPILILMAPSIELDYECLVDVQLPFAEDLRLYRFPPLDMVVTVSGKQLQNHRNLPSDDLVSSMSDYVDAMDLSNFPDGEEYAAPEDTYSPLLHRLEQAIRFRAIHSTDPIPPPYEVITRYSNSPKELVSQSQDSLDSLIKIADVKKVPPRLRAKRGDYREPEKPLSGLDVTALLASRAPATTDRTAISPTNPIPEFKQLLQRNDDLSIVREASKNFQHIIEDQVSNSFGDANYARAIEEMGVLRDELTQYEEPETWNGWIRQFKQKLLKGDFGGDRRELWWEIRKARLGLIDKKALEISEVVEEEATEFLRGNS